MRQQAGVDTEWIFPAPEKAGHRTAIELAWRDLRTAADIPGVRLHDLRHCYASILASSGLSLPVIGALLGHASPTTTLAMRTCWTIPCAAPPKLQAPSSPASHKQMSWRYSRLANEHAQADRGRAPGTGEAALGFFVGDRASLETVKARAGRNAASVQIEQKGDYRHLAGIEQRGRKRRRRCSVEPRRRRSVQK